MLFFFAEKDVLFAAMGNDAILLDEDYIKDISASPKTAGRLLFARHAIDSHKRSTWESNLRNSWFNALRNLSSNASGASKQKQKFMQNAAYWFQKMETQMASYAELKHNNLLYLKESFSWMASCEFPSVLVEVSFSFFFKFFFLKIISLNFFCFFFFFFFFLFWKQ